MAMDSDFDASAPTAGEGAITPGTGTGAVTETHAEQKVFPPFDATTFASQLFWFAITFIAFYLLMKRVALPRIAGILADRKGRISGDLEAAEALKAKSEAAQATYEKALSEARGNANRIADSARDEAKVAAATKRTAIESDLAHRLQEAETRIAEIKTKALAEVGGIASDTAQAVVAALSDVRVTAKEVEKAVGEALGERSGRV
jgi:F-type H+-transporting ATPase subunit b